MSIDVATDPVCGMIVRAGEGFTATFRGRSYQCCSQLCLNKFLANTEAYAGATEQAATRADPTTRHIAYFSMEVAVEPLMPTYSGGLGVLAGDTLRSFADLKIPAVGVSLLYNKGYFDQKLDEQGNQREVAVAWEPKRFLRPLDATVAVVIEGRTVYLRAWQYDVTGFSRYVVALILLDTSLPDNSPADRDLTAYLYGGDAHYRLAQEIVLGIGGVRMLRALGYTNLYRYHMNEGHAALLTFELLREQQKSEGNWDFNRVRERCVFTTHTPVEAGRDRFSYDLVRRLIEPLVPPDVAQMLGGADQLDLTVLALNLSRYVNGVAKSHGQVSRQMFPGYPIDSITNGVHSATWTSDSFKALYDRYIPGWRNDPSMLRHATSLPRNEVWKAHSDAKSKLFDQVRRRTGVDLAPDAFTIGFARRSTQYKRADLIFEDIGQLELIAKKAGPLQFVFAGKAHPKDEPGKELIRRVFAAARQLAGRVPVVYLDNYNTELAALLTAGADLWLNTPLPPLEASGTSGMKAAHNGVPSLSVLDGWWIEGHIEGVTGWAIGARGDNGVSPGQPGREEAQDVYRKLGTIIAPMFHGERVKWIDVMRECIAFNASFFNTHRMVQQYAANAYL